MRAHYVTPSVNESIMRLHETCQRAGGTFNSVVLLGQLYIEPLNCGHCSHFDLRRHRLICRELTTIHTSPIHTVTTTKWAERESWQLLSRFCRLAKDIVIPISFNGSSSVGARHFHGRFRRSRCWKYCAARAHPTTRVAAPPRADDKRDKHTHKRHRWWSPRVCCPPPVQWYFRSAISFSSSYYSVRVLIISVLVYFKFCKSFSF